MTPSRRLRNMILLVLALAALVFSGMRLFNVAQDHRSAPAIPAS